MVNYECCMRIKGGRAVGGFRRISLYLKALHSVCKHMQTPAAPKPHGLHIKSRRQYVEQFVPVTTTSEMRDRGWDGVIGA
jgi:hypothetical protein